MSHFYKNIRDTEIKVGLFSIACVLILFFSYSWLNDWFLQNKYTTVTVLFDSIGNLEKGSTVYYRGVRVGKVNNIKITNEGVLVFLYVEKEIKFGYDDQFLVKDKDMMGTKMVDIVPGNNKVLSNNTNQFKGKNVLGLTELITKINDLMINIDEIITKIDTNEQFFQHINSIVAGLDQSVVGVQDIIKNINDSDLQGLLKSLKDASDIVTKLSNSLIEPIGYTFDKVDSLLIETTLIVQKIQEKMNNEDSNFSKLFNDDELYKNLLDSSHEVQTLLEDIKKNPKKYFKISVF